MEPLEIEQYKGHTIEIHHDEDPQNPRDNNFCDNLATMVCFHNRYDLGDSDHGYKKDEYTSWEDLKKAVILEHGPCVMAPLYLYDHSGITISMGKFDCQWDSGQVGFIFVPYSKIRKEYSVKRISKKLIERIQEYLKGEVETYDNYLTGCVYGFKVLDAEGEELEDGSCWGFYGAYDTEGGPMDEAKKIVDYEADTFRKAIRDAAHKAEVKAKNDLANKLDAALIHQQELNKVELVSYAAV